MTTAASFTRNWNATHHPSQENRSDRYATILKVIKLFLIILSGGLLLMLPCTKSFFNLNAVQSDSAARGNNEKSRNKDDEEASDLVTHDHTKFARQYNNPDLSKPQRRQLNKQIFDQTQTAIRNGFSIEEGTGCHLTKPKPAEIIRPVDEAPPRVIKYGNTEVEVTNESTFAATQRLCESGFSPLVLDMANGTRIGGNPDESDAQEESLCRQSSLYPSLAAHKNSAQPKQYTKLITANFEAGGALLVKDVQFFRTGPEGGYQFIKPFKADIIASSAYDCNKTHGKSYNKPENQHEYIEGMKNRIRTVFATAIKNRNDSIVFSAYGCGAFSNDPYEVAKICKKVFNEYLKGVQKVTFAILDNPNGQNISAFREQFSDKYYS